MPSNPKKIFHPKSIREKRTRLSVSENNANDSVKRELRSFCSGLVLYI